MVIVASQDSRQAVGLKSIEVAVGSPDAEKVTSSAKPVISEAVTVAVVSLPWSIAPADGSTERAYPKGGVTVRV